MDPTDKLKRICEAIQKKLGGRTLLCGICGGSRWGLSQAIVKLPVDLNINTSGGLVIGGEIMPLAMMVCESCGQALSFNLVTLGLWAEFQKMEQLERGERLLGQALDKDSS